MKREMQDPKAKLEENKIQKSQKPTREKTIIKHKIRINNYRLGKQNSEQD